MNGSADSSSRNLGSNSRIHRLVQRGTEITHQDSLLTTTEFIWERPILSSIPIIGALFRSRKTDKIKTNLMVFIRAKILRDSAQTAFETNAKYNYIRDVQQGGRGVGRVGNVAIMPGTDRPTLPPLDELLGNKSAPDDSPE